MEIPDMHCEIPGYGPAKIDHIYQDDLGMLPTKYGIWPLLFTMKSDSGQMFIVTSCDDKIFLVATIGEARLRAMENREITMHDAFLNGDDRAWFMYVDDDLNVIYVGSLKMSQVDKEDLPLQGSYCYGYERHKV